MIFDFFNIMTKKKLKLNSLDMKFVCLTKVIGNIQIFDKFMDSESE